MPTTPASGERSARASALGSASRPGHASRTMPWGSPAARSGTATNAFCSSSRRLPAAVSASTRGSVAASSTTTGSGARERRGDPAEGRASKARSPTGEARPLSARTETGPDGDNARSNTPTGGDQRSRNAARPSLVVRAKLQAAGDALLHAPQEVEVADAQLQVAPHLVERDGEVAHLVGAARRDVHVELAAAHRLGDGDQLAHRARDPPRQRRGDARDEDRRREAEEHQLGAQLAEVGVERLAGHRDGEPRRGDVRRVGGGERRHQRDAVARGGGEALEEDGVAARGVAGERRHPGRHGAAERVARGPRDARHPRAPREDGHLGVAALSTAAATRSRTKASSTRSATTIFRQSSAPTLRADAVSSSPSHGETTSPGASARSASHAAPSSVAPSTSGCTTTVSRSRPRTSTARAAARHRGPAEHADLVDEPRHVAAERRRRDQLHEPLGADLRLLPLGAEHGRARGPEPALQPLLALHLEPRRVAVVRHEHRRGHGHEGGREHAEHEAQRDATERLDEVHDEEDHEEQRDAEAREQRGARPRERSRRPSARASRTRPARAARRGRPS